MTQEGSKYTFSCHDGYFHNVISGTTQEIALSLFMEYMSAPTDGYGVGIQTWPESPFWLDVDTNSKEPEIYIGWDTIDPKPSQELLKGLNDQIKRLFKLKAFA